MFNLNLKDVAKGIIVAVLTGIALPIAAMVQTPGFDISTVNLQALFVLAENGALVGFFGYIVKNFFSNSQGQFLGRFG